MYPAAASMAGYPGPTATDRSAGNGHRNDHEPAPRSTFLYRMEAQLTEFVPIGIFPEGLRTDNAFEGTITRGEPAGARVRGIDYYLIRPDGVGVVAARETIAGDGFAIGAHARGYVVPPAGLEMPPLEALLRPDFVWLDRDFAVRVMQTFETTSPAHLELNRTVAVHLGTVNYATGALVIDSYRLDPTGFSGTPA